MYIYTFHFNPLQFSSIQCSLCVLSLLYAPVCVRIDAYAHVHILTLSRLCLYPCLHLTCMCIRNTYTRKCACTHAPRYLCQSLHMGRACDGCVDIMDDAEKEEQCPNHMFNFCCFLCMDNPTHDSTRRLDSQLDTHDPRLDSTRHPRLDSTPTT